MPSIFTTQRFAVQNSCTSTDSADSFEAGSGSSFLIELGLAPVTGKLVMVNRLFDETLLKLLRQYVDLQTKDGTSCGPPSNCDLETTCLVGRANQFVFHNHICPLLPAATPMSECPVPFCIRGVVNAPFCVKFDNTSLGAG